MTRQILYRGVALTVPPNETDIEVVRRFEEQLAVRDAQVRLPVRERDVYDDLGR